MKTGCREKKGSARNWHILYGARDAAINWFEEHSQQLVSNGFVQGVASFCVFYYPSRNLRTIVHGGDYVPVGKGNDLQWLESRLKHKYQINIKWFGPNEDHDREVRVLNAIITWSREGMGHEVDF